MVEAPAIRPDDLPGDLPARRDRLRSALAGLMQADGPARIDDDAFDRIALSVFRYQVDANPVYGAFVSNRGVDPREIESFTEIPAVPASAFKEVPLVCRDPRPIEAVFRTTGTTLRSAGRGEHRVRDLSLYRASLLSTAKRFLRPELTVERDEKKNRIRILSLTPAPEDRADSSLVFMIGTWIQAWDDGASGFFSDASWDLRSGDLDDALRGASRDGAPTLVVGTAFSFVHWLDRSSGSPVELPPGSLVVETGGFKGRSRSVSRRDLYRGISNRLSVPGERIVNEYGMTEMLSQFYEPTLLLEGPAGPELRWHAGPSWVRTRILDPTTLAPVPDGRPGLLCHVDLANLDSVTAILTEDLGIEVEGGFRLLGRSEGAEPRGCSLAMEDLMNASRASGG